MNLNPKYPIGSKENNRDLYSQLYKTQGNQLVKLSDNIYRKGGMCSNFEDGYCSLIKYDKAEEGLGNHCIVNEKGEIALQGSTFNYPYHKKGVVASMDNKYYHLETGEVLAEGSSSFSSKDYIFVQSRWDGPVVKIKFEDGSVEIFD